MHRSETYVSGKLDIRIITRKSMIGDEIGCIYQDIQTRSCIEEQVMMPNSRVNFSSYNT